MMLYQTDKVRTERKLPFSHSWQELLRVICMPNSFYIEQRETLCSTGWKSGVPMKMQEQGHSIQEDIPGTPILFSTH